MATAVTALCTVGEAALLLDAGGCCCAAAAVAATLLAMLLAKALKAVWGTSRGMRGTRRRPSMAQSDDVLGPTMRSAMVFSRSSFTARRISARWRSSDMQRILLSSCSVFFLSLVNSP